MSEPEAEASVSQGERIRRRPEEEQRPRLPRRILNDNIPETIPETSEVVTDDMPLIAFFYLHKLTHRQTC